MRLKSTCQPAAVIWKLDWGWRICSQDGSCWLLAEALISSPYRPLHRTAWLQNIVVICPQSQWSALACEKYTVTSLVFYWSHRKVMTKNYIKHEYQAASITWGHLGGWLPNLVLISSTSKARSFHRAAVRAKHRLNFIINLNFCLFQNLLRILWSLFFQLAYNRVYWFYRAAITK